MLLRSISLLRRGVMPGPPVFRRCGMEHFPEEPVKVREVGKAGAFCNFRQFPFCFRKQAKHLLQPPFSQRLRDGHSCSIAVTAAQVRGCDLQFQGNIPQMKGAGEPLFDLSIDDLHEALMQLLIPFFRVNPAELSQKDFQIRQHDPRRIRIAVQLFPEHSADQGPGLFARHQRLDMMSFLFRLESWCTGTQQPRAIDDAPLTFGCDRRGEDEIEDLQHRRVDVVAGLIVRMNQKKISRFQREVDVVAVTLRLAGDDPGEFEEIPRGTVPLRVGIMAERVSEMEHGQTRPGVVERTGSKLEMADGTGCHGVLLSRKILSSLSFFNTGFRGRDVFLQNFRSWKFTFPPPFVLQEVFDEVLIEKTTAPEFRLEFVRRRTPHTEIQHQQIRPAEMAHMNRS